MVRRKEDKKMRRISIGIDSSNNLSYSMIVAGPERDINRFHDKMVQILKTCNIKIMHFSEIDKKIMKSISKTLADLINTAKRISFIVFEHRKPADEPHRGYFLEYVPENIAEYLKSFDDKNRLIQIDVHDDYRVRRVSNSTNVFMDKLMRKLSRKLSRDDVGIKPIPNGKRAFETSKILSKNENYIKIRVRCIKQQSSKSINIADMSLGFFKIYKPLVKRKITFRKI